MPKLVPFLPYILPAPSTLNDALFPLSLDEFLTQCTTSKVSVVVLNAARAILPTYYAKLQTLKRKAEETETETTFSRQAAPRAAGSVLQRGARKKDDALSALSGRDPTGNETGFVQRIARDGRNWEAVERLEEANRDINRK